MRAYTLKLTLRLAVGVSLMACLCLMAGRALGAQFNRSPILVFAYESWPQQPIFLVDVERNLLTLLTSGSSSAAFLSCSVNGQVAFTFQDAGQPDIYTMDVFSRYGVQVTEDFGSNFFPSWSPDGQHLAFVSTESGSPEIYITDFSDKPPQKITDQDVINDPPVWSPDGSKILFTSYRDSRYVPEIYAVTIDGLKRRKLTSNEFTNYAPAWSPDGRFIAFSTNRDGNFEVYLINSDGESPRRLTLTDAHETTPVWSPDGEFIAYLSWSALTSEVAQLYVMDAEGTNQHLLADGLTTTVAPTWSSDANNLAFTEARGGIYLIDVEHDDYWPVFRDRLPIAALSWCP